jgi:hypothetical protein
MAYFNHAFQKAFLATGKTLTGQTITKPDNSTIAGVATDYGYLNTAGVPTYGLNQLSATSITTYGEYYGGYVGWFNPKDNLSVAVGTGTGCCPLYLAASTIYCKDKISPFLGGYQETNKSKLVNPKYVNTIYDVDPCPPTNNVVHVGSTYWTKGGGVLTVNAAIGGVNTLYAVSATGVIASPVTTTGTGSGMVISYDTTAGGKVAAGSITILSPGKGYAATDTVTIPYSSGAAGNAIVTIATVTAANYDPLTKSGGTACCKEFLCGETYYLRLDVKGSPALRFLNHNAYYIAEAYTGCCPAGAIAPTAVNSTNVMILWANALLNSPIVSPFIQIAVQDEAGVIWYAPGTSAAFLAAEGASTWDKYNTAIAHTTGACAGLIINGAYVDTRFGDCTFQISDFYEKQPVNLYPSEVDLNGDPCEFSGVCVVNECLGSQAMGLGETVLREVVLSESYRQNFFASDFRIREITQGNQIVNAISRQHLYYKVHILHSVPRFNNPSGTFDNDQYLLEVVFWDTTAGTGFWTALKNWLSNSACTVCEVGEYTCNSTCTAINFPALPAQCGI